MTSLRSGSATDVGRRRQNNQDMILESETIFAVADGMGGHQGGEVASLTAIEALRAAFGRQPTMDGFELAIREANSAVEREAQNAAELRNMGTTLTAIALIPDGDGNGDLLTVANIGDSRAYLVRDGELSQLTADHSVPQELFRQGQLTEAEAATDPRRNILTRVLGPSFGEGPDLQNIVPYAGDRLLLCSDGLYNEVEDTEIARVLRKVAEPADAARQLVELANTNGGADNISVIVIDVVDDDDRAATASATLAAEPPRAEGGGGGASGLMTAEQRNTELRRLSRTETAPARAAGESWEERSAPAEHEPPARRVTLRVVAFVVVLVVLLAGAAGAVAIYARGAYFVGLDAERVVIFKGRPGGLLWFRPTVEERTPLSEDAVPPARLADVRSGHEVATLEKARRYIDNLGGRAPGGAPGGTATTTVEDPAGGTPDSATSVP